MSKLIAVVNEKGGVGKTTTSTEMAYLLSQEQKKVLLIDFDAQANATLTLGIGNPNKIETKTINDIMEQEIIEAEQYDKKSYIIKLNENLELIPSNSRLTMLSNNLVNADLREFKFKNFIDTIKNDYDYVIIDCMPKLGLETMNILVATDYVLIPDEVDIYSIHAMEEILKHIDRVKKKMNSSLEIIGIVKTKVNEQLCVTKELDKLIIDSFGTKVNIMNTIIPKAEAPIREAHAYGKTCSEYKPTSKVVEAYKNLIKEIHENGI